MIRITQLFDRLTSSSDAKQDASDILTDAQIAEKKKHRFSADWLFERHPKEEIRRWVYGLEYGYYHRAVGGHANDGDYFSINFYYKSKRDLLRTMSRLGITLYRIKHDDPRVVPGVSYTADEWDKLRDSINDVPEYEEPGLMYLHGVRCVCSIHKGQITFSFTGGKYEVNEHDFEDVRKIEALVKSKGLANKVSRANEGFVGAISKTMYADMLE